MKNDLKMTLQSFAKEAYNLQVHCDKSSVAIRKHFCEQEMCSSVQNVLICLSYDNFFYIPEELG